MNVIKNFYKFNTFYLNMQYIVQKHCTAFVPGRFYCIKRKHKQTYVYNYFKYFSINYSVNYMEILSEFQSAHTT